MKTRYGDLNVGDKFTSVDGSGHQLTVIDIDTYADKEDAVVQRPDGREYRIDWFKLMVVRYISERINDT